MANAIDSILLKIAPGWANRRAQSRLRYEVAEQRRTLMAHFAAAERSRLTSDWNPSLRSADGALMPDMNTLNARARDAMDSDGHASSIAQGYRRHVVGIGITARANARDPNTGELFDNFNKKADRLWNRWARRSRFCDAEGRKSLTEIMGLAVNEFVAVGQSFALWSYQPRRETVGLKLQLFEPEQLDQSQIRSPNGNWIRNGIEIDGVGAAVAYYLFVGDHPLDLRQGKSQRVPASRVFHLMRQNRVRQTHGYTRLASVLHKLRHLRMYDEYQLVAARLQACLGTFIESDEAPQDYWGQEKQSGDDGKDADGRPKIEMAPGMIHWLKKGETPHFFSPSAPGEFYEDFSLRQIHQIAAGAGLDYPTVTRDFSGNTFSGQRQGMLERDAETDPLQLLMIDQLLRPIRDVFITLAILEGKLDAPGFFEDPELAEEYLEAEWQGPPKEWIDPANQARAAETEIKLGVTTRRRIQNQRNSDWRETIQQLGDEEKLAKSVGVSINPSTQQVDPAANQPDPNAPDPELEQIKAEVDAYGVSVRAGVITPQTEDENSFRSRLKLPPMSNEARQAWAADKGVRRPITLLQPGGTSPTPMSTGAATTQPDQSTEGAP